MKVAQITTQTQAVLLRSNNGIATPVKNSSCAAASLIASSSATAEALIPHEKLRGAALADATLNAQNRPLAQPAKGYKWVYSPKLRARLTTKECQEVA